MSDTSHSGGIGFTGLLTIVFITLKLTGYIDWTWWWVMSPVLFAACVWSIVLTGLLGYFVLRDKRQRDRLRGL